MTPLRVLNLTGRHGWTAAEQNNLLEQNREVLPRGTVRTIVTVNCYLTLFV